VTPAPPRPQVSGHTAGQNASHTTSSNTRRLSAQQPREGGERLPSSHQGGRRGSQAVIKGGGDGFGNQARLAASSMRRRVHATCYAWGSGMCGCTRDDYSASLGETCAVFEGGDTTSIACLE